jgi:hypothetical protein
MQSSYTINEVGANSVVISISLWKGVLDYKVDRNGRLHITTMIYDIELKNYVKDPAAHGTNHVLGYEMDD